MDQAARQGFNNGAFEDSEEDTSAIVEEFFPSLEDQHNHIELQAQLASSLPQKLESQASGHKDRTSTQQPLSQTLLRSPYSLRNTRMKYHKLIAGETTGTYVMESPVTEADILQMAQQLAMSRLSKGRALTEPKQVFSHLQTLLQYHEHEVFALLLLDSKHRVIAFRELFRGTLDGASVYPREVVKIALELNAAAVILVHNHPSGDPEPSQADRTLTLTLKNALSMIGTQTLDHIVVGHEGCVSLAQRGYL